MKRFIEPSNLTDTEKTIMEFLLDEHRSLEEEIESGNYSDFIEHYRDQTGYIMANVENILKSKDSRVESVITSKQMKDLIDFLNKEYSHAADTVDPKTSEDATYIEGIVNEGRFFASRVCCILGLDSAVVLKENGN